MSVGALKTNPAFLKMLQAKGDGESIPEGLQDLLFGNPQTEGIEGIATDEYSNLDILEKKNKGMDFAQLLSGMKKEEGAEGVPPNKKDLIQNKNVKSGNFLTEKDISNKGVDDKSLIENNVDGKKSIEKFPDNKMFFGQTIDDKNIFGKMIDVKDFSENPIRQQNININSSNEKILDLKDVQVPLKNPGQKLESADQRPSFTPSSLNEIFVNDEQITNNQENLQKVSPEQFNIPKNFEGYNKNFIAINKKENAPEIFLKKADEIVAENLNSSGVSEISNTVEVKPGRRLIPNAYKSEAPFIQMKKNSATSNQNGELKTENTFVGQNNLESSTLSANQSQHLKLDQFRAPVTQKSENEGKVLDLSNIGKGNVNQIINRIASYIEGNKMEAKNGIDLTVRHQDIGEFKIHAERSNKMGHVDLEIIGKNQEAHRFFSQHEDKLVAALDTAGVKIGEFKLTAPNQIGRLLNENSLIGQNSNSSSSSFGRDEGRSSNTQANGREFFSSQNGGDKRRDLWKQAEDQYRDFKNKAA